MDHETNLNYASRFNRRKGVSTIGWNCIQNMLKYIMSFENRILNVHSTRIICSVALRILDLLLLNGPYNLQYSKTLVNPVHDGFIPNVEQMVITFPFIHFFFF